MQKEIEIIKQNPELLKDVKLFKLVLTPLELYVLRYFLSELHPLNVRDIYTRTLFMVFQYIFGNEIEVQEVEQRYSRYLNDLCNANYLNTQLDKRTKEKEFKAVVRNKEFVSETGQMNLFYKTLKKYKARVPSYEKFKAIVENFENVGVVYKRAKEGKIILYALNPHFYNMFKDKIEEIIKL